MTRYVLWGKKYVPVTMPITDGTLSECETQKLIREAESGWVELEILPETERPRGIVKEGGKHE